MCAFVHRSLRCNPMPPRITEESYRPRVSDRTMCYRLFEADNPHPACSFQKPNGVVVTKTWNHSGKEKKVSRLQRETAHSRIECARSKVGLNAETKKSVGIEPTGELFLLTFTLIGPSEFVSYWIFENVASKTPTGSHDGTGMSIVSGLRLNASRVDAKRANHSFKHLFHLRQRFCGLTIGLVHKHESE